LAGSRAESKLAPDAFTVIHSRKSVRNYTGEKVAKDDLVKIVRAGMAAPSAVNMQPWSFVIVTDRSQMDALAAGLPYAKMLDKAGAAIVVCALSTKAFQNKLEYAILDASCASENILLAAEALGLGAVWTAVYPEQDRENLVRKVLGIPENVLPFCVIPVGRPTGVDMHQDKFDPENIHWGKW
jgi:nitroreductase